MKNSSSDTALKMIRQAKRDRSVELHLHRMGLSELPKEILQLDNVKILSIGGNNFTSVPPEVFQMPWLLELDLSRNPIDVLPADIEKLSSLKVLNLTQMKLKNFPEELCRIEELENLFAGHNFLEEIPKGFSQLCNLRGLFLHKNNFKHFPAHLKNYQSLEVLTLGESLRAVPKRIAKFKKLKRLCLTDNKLEIIPSELEKLSHLQSLELSGNRLTKIPPEISRLTNLNELTLRGNNLPASLLSAELDGVKVLLAQIRSLTNPEKIGTLREAKLMITGEGKVGKSCLRMALDGSIDPDVDRFNSTTWGVDCGTLSVPDADSEANEILFNYWDFGGQKIYRITHEFFYSDQGLYLLVWDPRLGEEQCLIRDWLTRISARTAGRAKVILVATHAEVDGGNYSPEVDLTRFSEELRNLIVEQVSVDSFTGKNINKLREMMARHAKGLPGIKSPINRDWDNARKKALDPNDTAPWMSYQRFEEICKDFGIEDRDAVQSIAATFLHRLGKGVWYGIDWENDAFLRDTIVRDPSWLAMAFMEVVQHEPTKAAGGVLDHSDLPEVWINHGREGDGWRTFGLDDHQRLMRMMRAQGVALPTKASNGEKSLIPQLVPTDMPQLPWSSPDELDMDARILRMRTTIEPVLDGFMSHLIASLEPYHFYLDGGRGAFWQNGMFLRDAGGRFKNDALVTLRDERNFLELEISVTGEEPGLLLQQIDASISECLKFWPGSSRDDKVACPQYIGGHLCTGEFKLSNVERWLRKEQENAICHECDRVSSPVDLIYGLRSRDRTAETSERLLGYLAYKEQRPAPSSIVLLPAKARWKDIKSWEVLGRTRMKAQLRSEFSGALVAEKDFTATPGLLKYLGPVAKLGSLFFAAVPLPLDLTPGFAESFGELSDALGKLGDQLPEGEQRRKIDSPAGPKNLALVAAFLEAIELSPRSQGMDLERAPDGKWYWMAPVEVEQYRPTFAATPMPM